jgi:imidazolonepropionase-like amidohydrolase
MGLEVDDFSQMRRAVRTLIKRGADVIKVMATGGALTPGSSVHRTQFRLAELEPLVDEAHAHGLKVAAHANALEGLRNAVLAGVDSIEHGSYADRATIELMAAQGTCWAPTITPAKMILEGPRAKEISAQRIAAAGQNWQARREAVQIGIELGIKMVVGTDAGVTLTEHGLVPIEIEAFHDLGMSPMQAIQTATSQAAESLGLADQVGSIVEGRQADLILVEGDPLEDLSILRQSQLVMKQGSIVRRAPQAGGGLR